MSARVRRMPLICSALLGALVVSCGGPPVYVVAPPAPAAAPAPAPQGGVQGGFEDAPPPPVQAAPPVQEASPAPVVAPAPAAPAPATRPPAPVSGRPGGASSLVELSDAANGGTLEAWRDQQVKACAQAGYLTLEPGCVRIQKEHFDQDGNPIQGRHKKCDDGTVKAPESTEGPDGKQYIRAGTTVTVNFTCDPADKDNSGGKKKEQDSQTGNSGGTGG
jgi:hypothetical protein